MPPGPEPNVFVKMTIKKIFYVRLKTIYAWLCRYSFFSKMLKPVRDLVVKYEPLKIRFERIYYTKGFGSDRESISGAGSSLKNTESIRDFLPKVVKQLEIKTIFDVPCGDLNWLSRINLDVELYIGADIVPEIIENNRRLYGTDRKIFTICDATRGEIPQVDLILCRDLFIHLPNDAVIKVIKNFKNSGSKFLLASTYADVENSDLQTKGRRFLNLQQPPFSFPKPLQLFKENEPLKFIGLWKLPDIRI
jgi:hypothetical protein